MRSMAGVAANVYFTLTLEYPASTDNAIADALSRF